MYKQKYMLGIVVLCMIFIVGLVSAQPPFETNNFATEGLQVFYPPYENVQQNTGFELHVHVSNISNGYPLTNDLFNCTLHLYNTSGIRTAQVDLENDANTWDKELWIEGANFSDVGYHSFYIWCVADGLGGSVKGSFLVTESGVDYNEGRSLLMIGLLTLLVFFVFLSLYSLFSVENYIGKFALYWVSHVLMIIITFVAWQVGVEGLLGGTAITSVFKIMFYVFSISAFPMIILSLAWIFYIHTFNEHFQKLVDKGVDTEEAFRIANKKRGGWFNGM